MRKLLPLAMLAALAIAPGAVMAQPAMSASTLGIGPHGWDYYIGSWSCTNSVPSAMGGPASQALVISRGNAGTALYFRVTAQGFDGSGYVAYSAKTNTWSNPVAYADGSYSYESTSQTGKKTVWAGSYFNATSGATTQIRDTYDLLSASSYTDVTQIKSGAVWKTTYKGSCTKS